MGSGFFFHFLQEGWEVEGFSAKRPTVIANRDFSLMRLVSAQCSGGIRRETWAHAQPYIYIYRYIDI